MGSKLVQILVWFIILEVFSRIIISTPFLYDHYIKCVSDAGARIDFVRQYKPTNKKNSHHYIKIYDPTRGWAVMSNVTNQIVFDNKILNTNSKGIRGKIEYSYDKDPNRTRILILGDSFTFGDEVSDTETYPFYLQQMLPQAEVINMGVSGYGDDQMYIYLLEEGLKYHPDIILVGHGPWDNIRNFSTFFFRPKPRFLWADNHLVLDNSPVHPYQWYAEHEFWRSKFLDLMEILRFDILEKTGAVHQGAEEITYHILSRIVHTSLRNNAKIMFVPMTSVIPHEKGSFYDPAYFCGTWESKGVPCISIKPISKEENKNTFAGGHYKPFVNKLIAQGIKSYLLSNNLIK